MPSLPRRNPHHPADATATRPRPVRVSRSRVQEAVEARDVLAAALTRAGIQLPAMDVRTPWAEVIPDQQDGQDRQGRQDEQDRNDDGSPASARYALVHLGVCSAPVAVALAAVIDKGAAR
ncbi:hypothetical protein GCM10010129_34600 [Streptomyces fumigatiscleroticus]|nr:hypothetical protein GCM10010129_34600 [Streptomyces fumigatiscleroticus]